MFHIFVLAYPTIFPQFCKPQAREYTVTRLCTLYHFACVAQVRSRLSSFKLFTDTRNEAGHETCFSSWSCDRNLNLRHTNAFL